MTREYLGTAENIPMYKESIWDELYKLYLQSTDGHELCSIIGTFCINNPYKFIVKEFKINIDQEGYLLDDRGYLTALVANLKKKHGYGFEQQVVSNNEFEIWYRLSEHIEINKYKNKFSIKGKHSYSGKDLGEFGIPYKLSAILSDYLIYTHPENRGAI